MKDSLLYVDELNHQVSITVNQYQDSLERFLKSITAYQWWGHRSKSDNVPLRMFLSWCVLCPLRGLNILQRITQLPNNTQIWGGEGRGRKRGGGGGEEGAERGGEKLRRGRRGAEGGGGGEGGDQLCWQIWRHFICFPLFVFNLIILKFNPVTFSFCSNVLLLFLVSSNNNQQKTSKHNFVKCC